MLNGVVGLLGIVVPPAVYWFFFLGNENAATSLTGSRDNLPLLVGGLSLFQFMWAFQEARSQNKWLSKNEQSNLFACFGINSLANMCALGIWLFSTLDGDPWDALAILGVIMFTVANGVRLLLTTLALSLGLRRSLNALKFILFEEIFLYGLGITLFLFLSGRIQ